MTDHVTDDDLVALALDELEPAERARLSGHLAGGGAPRPRGGPGGGRPGARRAAPPPAPPPPHDGISLGAAA